MTIKEHCCGADMLFDAKTAKKQYRQYLRKGPSRVTGKLISQLNKLSLGQSLIDVGGGIGAIQWWFLNHGGKHTFGIDASSGYLSIAQEHALKNNLKENTTFLMGDFTSYATQLPIADHVTLDKVICCYPDFKAIINLACTRSTHSVSLSYPMDGLIADVFRAMGVFLMKIRKNPFRPFVHPVASVREQFHKNGLICQSRELAFPWHIETYVKN